MRFASRLTRESDGRRLAGAEGTATWCGIIGRVAISFHVRLTLHVEQSRRVRGAVARVALASRTRMKRRIAGGVSIFSVYITFARVNRNPRNCTKPRRASSCAFQSDSQYTVMAHVFFLAAISCGASERASERAGAAGRPFADAISHSGPSSLSNDRLDTSPG